MFRHILLYFILLLCLEHHTKPVKKYGYIAEATVSFKGKKVAHISEHTNNMYTSIDEMAKKLTRALNQQRDRIIEKEHEGFHFSGVEKPKQKLDQKKHPIFQDNSDIYPSVLSQVL
jgi:ribosomal subunit interface protein